MVNEKEYTSDLVSQENTETVIPLDNIQHKIITDSKDNDNNLSKALVESEFPGDYYPIPQPEEITQREREDAMGAYLMMFASIAIGLPLPIFNLIASIVYYFTNRQKSRFVRFHAFQALISSILINIINAVAVIWLIGIYFFQAWELDKPANGFFLMSILINIFYFVINIAAAIKAKSGRMYYIPFFGRISYDRIFKNRMRSATEDIINKPPN
ncbi:MAG: hypothetical protein HW421_1481 [Ignavibacteria bacterium]|nr:hypothetical protein [Ignavibacteria bacterium]